MPRKYQNPKMETRIDVKRPYYFIRVTVPAPDGKRIRTPKILGFCDDTTKKEAQKRRAQALDLVNAGRVLAESQVRMRDLLEQFKEARIPQLGVAAQARYLSTIKHHIEPVFGDKKLSEIDRPSVEAWLTGKGEFSWWSRQCMRSVLAAVFTAAREWKVWSGDMPTTGVRIGRKTLKREKRLLTSDQLQAILAGVKNEQTRFMIVIALLLGLRISEVCGLQWGDANLEEGSLTIKRRWYRGDLDEPKTERSRRILNLGPLVDEFKRRYPGPQANEKYLFTEDGIVPVDERDVLRLELRPVLKRLGLYYQGFGWHAFRRQNITWRQTVGGATAIEAQQSAGHTRMDMTMIYSLTDAEREREQVGKMFDKLMEIPGGPVN